MKGLFNAFQVLGRALMLPIAVLPIAAILLRLGQADLLNLPFIAAGGDAIFSNLGLIFAVGVAVGLAKENHGASGLAALIGFFVITKGAEVILAVPADITGDTAIAAYKVAQIAKVSIPIGILSGIMAGLLYNRYNNVSFPSYFSFFAGKRWVPILTGLVSLLFAALFGYLLPFVIHGMDALNNAVVHAGELGLFVYGFLNRVLIVTGMHHILNSLVWFNLGEFAGKTGDLNRFFAGDPSAGTFMSGFFPVMMFGLPAACLAMYSCAKPSRKKVVGGLLLSLGLTSFLTGITEPIEFAFMFVAPILYVIHAILMGLSMVIMDLLQVKLGFGFSAGLFDYVLNYKLATKPLYLIPVGIAYFIIYFVIFRFAILKWNLKTPGRDDDEVGTQEAASSGNNKINHDLAQAYIKALGGRDNIKESNACMTRLRMQVNNEALIQEAELKKLGSSGMMKMGQGSIQVIVGPIADQLISQIRQCLNASPSLETVDSLAQQYINALGGKNNLQELNACMTRLRLKVASVEQVNENELKKLGAAGMLNMGDGQIQVIVGPTADQLISQIRQLT